MGRNSLAIAAALLFALVTSGCKSGGDGPSEKDLAEKARNNPIDLSKLSPKARAAIPGPARAIMDAQNKKAGSGTP